MNNCPHCNKELKAIDTRGIFPFESRASKVRWVIVFSFLIIVWSALILVLIPKAYQSIALLVYYPLSFSLLYKLYNSKLNSIVYECTSCKDRFKGKNL